MEVHWLANIKVMTEYSIAKEGYSMMGVSISQAAPRSSGSGFADDASKVFLIIL